MRLQPLLTLAITSLTLLPLSAQASVSQRDLRISHARELMGKFYDDSIVKQTEEIDEAQMNALIHRWTLKSLPRKWKSRAPKIARAILDESRKYQFDPIFLMAVIQSESSFIPSQKGKHGEIGLMQLMPSTAQWVAKRSHLRWHGKKTLLNPVANIRIGAAYLSSLRSRFDSQARLYLAAYNMGSANVHDALERHIWPKEYPIHVMTRYLAFYEKLSALSGDHQEVVSR
jgi:soluble lytic murein transglycosylase